MKYTIEFRSTNPSNKLGWTVYDTYSGDSDDMARTLQHLTRYSGYEFRAA